MAESSPYSTGARWRRVALELSLKPFADWTPGGLRARWREVLGAWERVLDRADALGVLLWTADGSEILSWSGDLNQPLEWARYIGFCNLDALDDLYYGKGYAIRPGVPFRDHPPDLTYADLRALIDALREVAAERGRDHLTVGATFDPGPEFASSPFKYQEHPEILIDWSRDGQLGPMRFVDCQARLAADPRPFGGFPAGIPADKPLGEFLGRQFDSLAGAVGFDYLWLSNGFGYSVLAWSPVGRVLHRGDWHPERVAAEREAVLDFWRSFRAVCDRPLEVRGTNFPLGCDLAVDGVPHRELAAVAHMEVAPPNIPVLVADHLPIDVTAYLTRIAKTPGRRIPYRHYLNDPWFEQNPWYDIYNREPLELYTAMSCARVGADGGVEGPTDLHVLSIDTERGDVPPSEVNEVAPHLLRALEERADAAGPVTWIYPYDEFCDLQAAAPERLPHVFFGDHFIERSIAGGLPLLTVCASDRFVELHQAGRLPATIWLAPTPAGEWAYVDALLDHVAAGGRALLYGPLDWAPPRLLDWLGIDLREPIEGDLVWQGDLDPDTYDEPPDVDRPLRHRAVTGAGGIREVSRDGEGLLADVNDGDEYRAYAVIRGGLAWIRGTVPFGIADEPPLFRLIEDPPTRFQQPGPWLRGLLARLGWDLRQHRASIATEPVRLFCKRHRGAFWLVGAKPETTVRLRLAAPDGAPVPTEYDTAIGADGLAGESFGKTIYAEVRCFVRGEPQTVKVKAMPFAVQHERCYAVTGLKDAAVTFFVDPAAIERVRVLPSQWADIPAAGQAPVPHRVDAERGCVHIDRHTGPLFIKW